VKIEKLFFPRYALPTAWGEGEKPARFMRLRVARERHGQLKWRMPNVNFTHAA
jgi:hypothetical protein